MVHRYYFTIRKFEERVSFSLLQTAVSSNIIEHRLHELSKNESKPVDQQNKPAFPNDKHRQQRKNLLSTLPAVQPQQRKPATQNPVQTSHFVCVKSKTEQWREQAKGAIVTTVDVAPNSTAVAIDDKALELEQALSAQLIRTDSVIIFEIYF